jgi:GGDEF domain-containing protein
VLAATVSRSVCSDRDRAAPQLAVSSLDALLQRAHAPAPQRAPLPMLAVATEHVRERQLAERDVQTGLKGPQGLRRKLREAWRRQLGSRVLLLVRIQLTVANRVADGGLSVLRELALSLQDNVSGTDLVARTATHELTVLMPGVDPQHAPSIGSRLSSLVARVTEPLGGLVSARISLELLSNPNAAEAPPRDRRALRAAAPIASAKS